MPTQLRRRKRSPRTFMLLVTAVAASRVAAPPAARADSLTWDADANSANGLQDGPGIWDTTTPHWQNNTNPGYVAWTNSPINDAVFGVNSGAAGTVTLGTGITVGNILFDLPGSGNYTI